MLLNLILGLWLMISPFVLVTLNRSILKTLWEDLLLGFGIAAFSLCRLLSRKEDEIVLSDWFVTALGFITLINPFLYSYFKLKAAAWNNLRCRCACAAFGSISRLVRHRRTRQCAARKQNLEWRNTRETLTTFSCPSEARRRSGLSFIFHPLSFCD